MNKQQEVTARILKILEQPVVDMSASTCQLLLKESICLLSFNKQLWTELFDPRTDISKRWVYIRLEANDGDVEFEFYTHDGPKEAQRPIPIQQDAEANKFWFYCTGLDVGAYQARAVTGYASAARYHYNPNKLDIKWRTE